MENNIDLTMADRPQELRDEKEQLGLSLKEANAMIKAVEQDLVAAMVTAGLDSFKRNGHSYSLKIDNYASAKAECKEDSRLYEKFLGLKWKLFKLKLHKNNRKNPKKWYN